MIPILYEGTETTFTSNGLGRLADAITCKVTEERNAIYELEMTYPVSGVHFDDIQENRIILAVPFDGGLSQPFQIYKITKPINGIVTVNAEHISYRLNNIIVMPFSATTPAAALGGIHSYSSTTNPFNFSTDKTTTGNFNVTVPTAARGLLCGQQGSVLDVFGKGDYEFNRFDVNLKVNRGADNGVTLRYGKNITDLKSTVDMTYVYTGICPYWADGEGNVVTLTEKVVLSNYADSFPYKIIKSVDFSSSFDVQPTEEQLRTKAQSYVENNQGWLIKNNVTVSFVALWGTEEYKNIAPLERVKMCDIVHIVYSPFDINVSAKVIKTEYNVLLERYNSITLGDSYYSLNKYISEEVEVVKEEQSSHMQKAIARATALITGGLGGHVVFNLNADGKPQEILIMDTDNISTAVSVIRMNKNGIGFSTTGYNGPFTTAWTIDGHFVADYIDSGTLNSDLIKAGTLMDEAGLNYWNMVTGDFRLTSGFMNGSPIANASNVSTSLNAAKAYADGKDVTTLSTAEVYARTQDAAILSAAQVYANNGVTNYDTYLNQTRVFNKLTNNGNAKGIYMTNGELYINGTYIKTGTLDASLVNVTNINASNITSGIIQDSSRNTKWNLSTGALSSKKFSIDSTYFQLSEGGTITSIATDGKKMVFDKGTIIGYKSNGTESARLEIGDGFFNIANGELTIKGVKGVSGSTSFVKGISYENISLGSVNTQDIYVLGQNNNSCTVSGGSVSLSGGGVSITGGTATGSISVSGYVDGKYVTLSNYNVSLTVSGISGTLTLPTVTYTNPSVSVYADRVSQVYKNTFGYTPITEISYAKAVSASTGSINSQYGIIQSIS